MPLTPPRQPTAPLNALRAFEAAGRCGSFLRAAEELSVTPGAIAQQVRKLETWSGGDLFERHPSGVTLTELGRRILPDVSRGLEMLSRAAAMLRADAGRARTFALRIAALPAIAQLWLTPRITALGRAVPAVEPSIHALDACPPLGRGEFDVAVYPVDPDMAVSGTVRVLARNNLTPVAAPRIAASIAGPADLAGANLIHDLAWKGDWARWLAAFGVGGVDSGRGPTHSLYAIAVERCVAGDGVLIGHTALIGQHLADGRLQALFPKQALPGLPLCLLAGSEKSRDPDLAAAIEALASA